MKRNDMIMVKRRQQTYVVVGLLLLLTLFILQRESLLLQIESSENHSEGTIPRSSSRDRALAVDDDDEEDDSVGNEHGNEGVYDQYQRSEPTPQPIQKKGVWAPPFTAGSGFDATHLFHVTTNRTLIEGFVFIKLNTKGIFPIDRKGWTQERYTQGKTYKFHGGRCYWCPLKLGTGDEPTSECRFGVLRAGPHKDDHGTHKTYRHRGHMLSLRTGISDEVYSRVKDFATTYLRCQINKVGQDPQIPSNVEGVLRVENYPDFVFYVNPGRSNVVTKKGSSVVCLKSTYGSELSAHKVVQHVSHYLDVFKFSRVLMYEQGLLRGMVTADLLRDARILAWVNQGKFQIVDLRDSLQRLYGAVGSDVTQFSGKQGQIMTIGDCALRAKVEGYEWVLNVDRDEILTPGPRMVRGSHVETWSELVRRVEAERKMAGLLPLHVIEFKTIRPNETVICDECQPLSIHKIIKWSRENENLARMALEFPKSAVRLDPNSEYPLISTIGIHNIARLAAFERGIYTENVTKFMTVQEYHMRHYNCLNEPSEKCESIPVAFAPRYEWALVQSYNQEDND